MAMAAIIGAMPSRHARLHALCFSFVFSFFVADESDGDDDDDLPTQYRYRYSALSRLKAVRWLGCWSKLGCPAQHSTAQHSTNLPPSHS